jgi:hypothetical protein
MIEICCVARLCHVVMMSYFLGNDATSVNAFYFAGYSQPLSYQYKYKYSVFNYYASTKQQSV